MENNLANIGANLELSLKKLCEDPRITLLSNALGAEADLHIVGGTIRDIFLGKDAIDIDLATVLLPEVVMLRLEKNNIRTIPTGLKHQTVMAYFSDSNSTVEITTFRAQGITPKSGVVSGRNIEEDVLLRDFTINAIAYSLVRRVIHDPTNGIADIKNKILRAVIDPEKRFLEDPLRIMRLLRFASMPGFFVEEATIKAATKNSPLLAEVSLERIREEFSKLLLSPSPDVGLRLMAKTGVLKQVLPEIFSFVGFEQNDFHHLDLFEHTLAVILGTPPELHLRLAALLHDVGKPATLSIDNEGLRHFYKHETVGAEIGEKLLHRLRYSHKVITAVKVLISTHMRPLDAGPGGLRRLLRDTGEYYPLWRLLKEADAKGCKIDSNTIASQLEVFDRNLQSVLLEPQVSPLKSLAINGDDLLNLGFKPGPIIGRVLKALHEKILDDPNLNTKDSLIQIAGEYFILFREK